MILDFDVFGEKQVSRDLLRFGDRVGDVRPAWTAIVNDMLDANRRQFDSQGRTGSGKWAALKPETIAFKASHGFPLEILRRTEALRNSLTHLGDDNQRLIIRKAGFTFASTVPYGIFHQLGAPNANLPQRRPVEFTDRERQGFVRTLQRFLMTGTVDVI